MLTFTVAGMAPAHFPVHIRNAIRLCPDSGCWLWQKSLSPDGYGWSSYKNKTYQAHRLVYTLINGDPIPGLHIDHLCRNRQCVNPAHMELVSPAENQRRSPLTPLGMERCLKCGGEFQMVGKAKPQRRCKICAAKRARLYRLENKERLAAKQREWNDANRDKVRDIWRRHDAKRRAAKANA